MTFRVAITLAALLCCGCATEHYIMDARHPAVEMGVDGFVVFRGKRMPPADLPRALRRAGIPHDREIDILVPDEVSDPNMLRRVMAPLARSGYRRPVCITHKRSVSRTKDGRDPLQAPGPRFVPAEPGGRPR